jgi:fatty-acyl-CoA synthase
MIYVLLDHPALENTDLSSLELLLYGASAMSPSRLVEGIERIGPVFSQLYGQTECYPVSVLRKADHDPRTPELFLSCGFPIAACQVKILDNDDREVATGEAGEICVRGPQVMPGYWQRPDETAKVLTRDGWLRTGDIGRLDDEGYLFIEDRKKDVIVVSGFKVYPNEIEDVATRQPGVLEAAAIGVPDAQSGEAVKLFIVRKDPSLTAAAVLAHARHNLTGYKVPRHVEFMSSLPKTNVGKVLRRALKEPGAAQPSTSPPA